MPNRASEYIAVVRRHCGKFIAGPSASAVGFIAAFVAWLAGADPLVVKWVAWVSAGVLVFSVFPAQYGAWREERERSEIFESELNAKADMRGTLWIRRPDSNPYADQMRAGSSLRFVCDCSNHGRKPCQVTRFRVRIEPRPDKGFDGYDNLVLVPPHKVVNTAYGEQFFFETSILVSGIMPADLAESKISVTLIDALGTEYPNMISKMDAPVSKAEL